MAKVNVKKPFILNLPTGHVHFVPGVVEIEDELAEHWYVQAHCEQVAEQVPEAGVVPVEVKKTGRKKKDQ